MTNRFFYPHSNDTDANRSKNHPARKPAVPSFLKIGTAEKRNPVAPGRPTPLDPAPQPGRARAGTRE